MEVEGEKIPMVEDSPVNFECAYYSTIRLPGNSPMGSVDVVIGEVVGIHIKEEVLTDGKIDVRKTQPIARCGYYEYAIAKETFEMIVPGDQKAMLAGIEGSTKFHRKMGGAKIAGGKDGARMDNVGNTVAGASQSSVWKFKIDYIDNISGLSNQDLSTFT